MKPLSFFLLLLLPSMLWSQGFQVNLQGQRQQAMGGAGTGWASDAATVFFNPGTVSFLKANSVSAGVSLTIQNTAFRDAISHQQFYTKSPISSPFTLYGTWGKSESRWKFGLGVYTPFGSTIKYEEGWTGRFVLTQMKLLSVFIQPTVSYKINEQWGIGAGLVYGYGHIDMQRDLPISTSTRQFASAQLTGTAGGWGANLGVYYKPIEKLSIGLSYRSQITMKVRSSEANFNVPTSLDTRFPDGTFKASLPLPQVITLGVGFHPSERITLVADVNFIGWSSYKNLKFDYSENTSSLKDTDSPRNYKNALAYRVGVQYNLSAKLALRGGANFEKTPVQNGYVTPEVPDADRLNFTGGIGYTPIEKLSVDLSFSYINFFKRTDTNKETLLGGTYKTNILVPGLSITYNF